jgi:hypothetical protein
MIRARRASTIGARIGDRNRGRAGGMTRATFTMDWALSHEEERR